MEARFMTGGQHNDALFPYKPGNDELRPYNVIVGAG